MSSSSPPSWLKETPLRFEDIARHHAPPITIYLPTINDQGNLETLTPEKYNLSPDTKGEVLPATEYQWRSLARESGVYCRKNAYFPRTLQWRTVAGGTLTIHSVDSVRPQDFPRNRPLTAIHFRFPVKIRPNCIGFAELNANVVLFVLTEECVLYNIPLPSPLSSGEDRHPSLITENMNVHRPLFLQARFGQGKLALELPHFMHVLDDSEKIIFAMQDGSLHQYNPYSKPLHLYLTDIDYAVLRFTGDATLRKALKTWIPTWSGHNPSYPAYIVLSAVASTKHSLLFTVSADQRLRIWSLDKSQFIKEYDITSSQANSGRLLPQPPAHLLALDDSHDHGEFLFYLLSYNPLEEGQFILWGGEHSHGAFTGLSQLQDPFRPEMPPGSTGIWNISDFFLAQVKTASDSKSLVGQNTYDTSLRLWISWKSYYTSILQYTDLHHMEWITIMPSTTDFLDDEIENSVEFWTERICRPGRFSDAVILTACNIYQNHLLPPELHRDLSSTKLLRKDM